jgi:hypothetical protein
VKPNLAQSGPFIGVGGMFVAAFLYGYTAIALPGWLHSVVMPLVWLLLFAVCCASFVSKPYRALAMPVLAVGVWFAVMLTAG